MIINYLDLFAGIGGFALGLQAAGFKFKNHYFSEIDKKAVECYEKHFPKAKPLGDIRTIRNVCRRGKIHAVSFGFPCQDLSITGKRAGLAGKRSSLFFEAARVIREVQPDFFVFENVRGLFGSNAGRDFETVLRTIADIGLYECQWQLLNTCWFLPQNRERIYFVGFLRKGSLGKIFPLEGCGKQDYELQGQKALCIKSGYCKAKTAGTDVVESELYEKTKRNPRYYRINNIDKSAVAFASQGGGAGAKNRLYCVGSKQKNAGILKDRSKVRMLTPVECEHLQGFPKGWTAGFSDMQRYKMLGNAVSVPMVEAVGKKILRVYK
jgi:DNA (cytosine-5)-methyltransferase 1